jgi:hypothetical protein
MEKELKMQAKAAKAEMRSSMTAEQLDELDKKKEAQRKAKERESKRKMEEYEAEKA